MKINKQIDRIFAEKMGRKVISLAGQTYSRSMDGFILDQLGQICSTLHWISLNIRLAQNDQEVWEPFDKKQVGSSAMPYKQNPMRCERICSLARKVIANKMVDNQSHQIMERSLDDSANRRLAMKESLMLTDYMITLMCNVVDGIKVFPEVIKINLMKQLPFIVTETIMMKLCQHGKDRQEVHHKIREVTLSIRQKQLAGDPVDFVETIKGDEYFSLVHNQIDEMMNPEKYSGLSSVQVDDFGELIAEYLEVKCQPFDISFSR